MPGRDGKGPMGQGAMTGRALGICGGRQKAERPRLGRRRWNVGFSNQELLEEEKLFLENRLSQVEEALKSTNE